MCFFSFGSIMGMIHQPTFQPILWETAWQGKVHYSPCLTVFWEVNWEMTAVNKIEGKWIKRLPYHSYHTGNDLPTLKITISKLAWTIWKCTIMRSAAIKLSFTFSYKLIGKVSPFILQYKSMLKVLFPSKHCWDGFRFKIIYWLWK